MKLEIFALTKKFNGHAALKNIFLNVPSAQALALLGPSGSGKSTLLRVVAGLIYPTNGEIRIDDKALIFEENALREYRLKLGILFQAFNLFPHLTALENISLPLYRVHGYSEEEADAIGMDLLKRFDMQKHANKKPWQLSGGQCQRVAIIRAIAIQPHYLFFDEPTSALDPLMTAEVLDLIAELKKEGRNLIIATHHLTFAKKICDWTVFLDDGRIVESKSTPEFFQNPESSEVKSYLSQVLKY